MTRDEALARITGAFSPPADGAAMVNDIVFAKRLLAALAALDLLKLDHDGQREVSEGSEENRNTSSVSSNVVTR
jgi:hypothetical protein